MDSKISVLSLMTIIIVGYYYFNNETSSGNPGKKFVSEAINSKILNVSSIIADPTLKQIYQNCFPNTLDTTVDYTINETTNKPDTFIITGDIAAMWQRDSTFQTFPYLPYAKNDSHLKSMLHGVINRQFFNLLIDPYPDAFNKDPLISMWYNDNTTKLLPNGERVQAMNKMIWERKYELCSPTSIFLFSYNFYKNTGELSFVDEVYLNGLNIYLNLIKSQMKGTDEAALGYGPAYTFSRVGSEPYDSLHQTVGSPGNTCNLVNSAFRNSDDSSLLPYNIPANALVVTELRHIAEILKVSSANTTLNITAELITEIENLADTIYQSIYKYGIITDPVTKTQYFAYEVDCYGNQFFMEDANFPSLISLPFFGFLDISDEIYNNTRKMILSNRNPYYFEGKYGNGVGSTHTPRQWIWPLFTLMRGLTATDENEILICLRQLYESAKSTGFMHESFNVNDPNQFTRSWFAWPNSFFGLFINTIYSNYPEILKTFK